MIKSLLVANRGEIACRIFRTARRLGVRTIAVFSDADARAQHVREADEAYRIGPAAPRESYLNIERILEAARATGAGTLTILRHHILGNVLGPVFIYASSLVSVGILLASGLSFLGLGVRPPTADWGLMLSTLRQSIYVNPVICALPGAAIFVTSICFNLVSDGLRAAMDVRM